MSTILGIETSCDETAASIISRSGHSISILAEVVASQIEIHQPFGGVVPEVASREHERILPPMVKSVLAEAGLQTSDLDGIAVTSGPGLMGALLVGISFAKGMGEATGKPVIPVHHLEAHLLAPGITDNLPEMPFITLLVSGGHSMLIRVNQLGEYQILGQSIDDAAGECFDKTARLLGLPYPGGPEVANIALSGKPDAYTFPRPLQYQDNYNFSFSGLKTSVLRTIQTTENLEQEKPDICASLQEAIVDSLIGKSLKACDQEGVSELVIAGGVAANQRLREKLSKLASAQGIHIHYPPVQYCTDNATMIAYTGLLSHESGRKIPENWDAEPRKKIGHLLTI